MTVPEGRLHRTMRVLALGAMLWLGAGAAMAQQTASGRGGMVVADQHLAADVGRAVLADGGNAIDAAVAVGYALAVVDPCCGNLGGGGFMTLHLADGRETVINFRERAPLRATPDMYLDKQGRVIPGLSLEGYLAVGVPGTVAGLERARREYGTRSRAALIAPAIRLAQDGFVLDVGDLATLGVATGLFAQQPNVAAIFLRQGQPLAAGDRLVQTNLAQTLALIAKDGPDAFYQGSIAARIVAASAAHGGILSQRDFAEYTAEEMPPVACVYRGERIVTAPPPSGGGVVLCEILNIVQQFGPTLGAFHSRQAVHEVVEAERQAYLDRDTYLGDPDFVDNPVAALLSPGYAARMRALIPPVVARPSVTLRPGLGGVAAVSAEGDHTTHYSVLDRWGNAVSVTYTINAYFGAGVIAGDTGFFLNDEMDDFAAKPGVPNQFGLVQGAANAIAPGKRPLSSMTPTIILKDGHVVMVVGAPGGSRIPTEVLGVIQNVIDHHMSLADAVAAPRIHHQYLPDKVYLEPDALQPDVAAALTGDGYHLVQEDHTWGVAEAIGVDPATGLMQGASDPRRPDGKAAPVTPEAAR
ncbi:MAG TPA: gamma-glutamyltransferase [Acetobacteraceae bacterium]|nr:gamma-glutamyltransferase [Acetobacteraceae bacterium]